MWKLIRYSFQRSTKGFCTSLALKGCQRIVYASPINPQGEGAKLLYNAHAFAHLPFTKTNFTYPPPVRLNLTHYNMSRETFGCLPMKGVRSIQGPKSPARQRPNRSCSMYKPDDHFVDISDIFFHFDDQHWTSNTTTLTIFRLINKYLSKREETRNYLIILMY